MSSIVFDSFQLPCGQTLKNRIAKAAMEENLASAGQLPNEGLFRLYEAWAKGGVGLIITGNVMVDHMAMTGPGGIALESDTDLSRFKTWAKTGKANDTKLIMQINHPGRQVFAKMGGKVLSPSDIPLDMGKHSKLFGQPRAMTESEIVDLISRFETTALKAKEAGFDGVQIHAAHGYLIAQFLSPLTNKREDDWGGSIEARAKLLIEVTKRIRAACGDEFIVAVKLNSADFQRGGFDVDEAQAVVDLLGELAVDFVELSGGSYEVPAMQGRTADDRTLAREAYFFEFADKVANSAKMPIMTTGGISRMPVAERVLDSNVELVGIASALASAPDLVNRWASEPNFVAPVPNVTWKDKTLSGLATMALVKRDLRDTSEGKATKQGRSPAIALIGDQMRAGTLTKRYRKQYAGELLS